MSDVAVVTGASKGIGAAIANELANAGYDVALWSRDVTVARKVARAIANEHGTRVIAQACDVRNVASVVSARTALVRNLGSPSVLVNNAATRSRQGRLEDLPLDAWDDVVNTNLRGAFVCSQAVGRLMLARGDGAIVNIASIGASMPQPLMGAFSASKAGLLALTRQIALEWGPRGVRCNAISPGLVPTHSGTAVYSVPGVREERAAMVPMRRLGTGQDVGRAVVFLGSSAASYINGTDLVIDGGLTLALIGLLPTVRPDGEIVNALPGQMPQT